jgi:hypothetical protein
MTEAPSPRTSADPPKLLGQIYLFSMKFFLELEFWDGAAKFQLRHKLHWLFPYTGDGIFETCSIMHGGLLQEHMHDVGVSEAAMGAAGGAAGASDCFV